MLCWERWHVHKCIMHFGNISFPNWCIKEPGWVGCGSAPWTASSLVFIRSLFWVSNYVMVWNKLWKGMSRYIKTASKWRSSKLFLIRWLLHFIATRIMIVELISGAMNWRKKKGLCINELDWSVQNCLVWVYLGATSCWNVCFPCYQSIQANIRYNNVWNVNSLKEWMK